MSFLAGILGLVCSVLASGHEGRPHAENSRAATPAPLQPAAPALFREINLDYASNVKTIFDQKCAACHSLESMAPWYAKVPLVGWIVESDRTEAKEHLEISKGFPFAGHGTIEEDLGALEESVAKNSMPTALYRLVHPSSTLTEPEKAAILAWVGRSREALKRIPAGQIHK